MSTPRVDAHQHFWKYSPEEYPWIGNHMAKLRRDFLPVDLAREFASVDFTASVAVQARQSLEESSWLLELAHAAPHIAGVVGWVDLRSEVVDEQLSVLSRQEKFVGVRHVVQDEPDDRFLLLPEFVRGLRRLREFGLTYDLLLYPQQLPAAIELVRMLADQPFVLDHLAKPQIIDNQIEPWREQIRELAKSPNVMCKLSGMITEADWESWQPADLLPYLETTFEAFGEDRVMFGSDWPVCLVAGEYGQVFGIVRDFVASMSTAIQDKVLGANAIRFYGLKLSDGLEQSR